LQAKEASSVVAETRTPTTPPPPVPAAAVEEGEAATEAIVTQAALEVPSGASPSVEGVVVVLEEDVAPPPASERHDAAVVLALESAQVPVTTSYLPAVEVPVPPLMMEVQGLAPTAEVAESSSARVSLTVEEMMDRESCWYIDLPGVGVIDLEAPRLPEKKYDVAVERRSNEPTIMEMIASVSNTLQDYEHACDFAPAAAEDMEDVALAVPAARVEPIEDASAPPHVDEGREASPPGLVEAAETPAPVVKPVSTGAVAGEVETSPPGPVTVEVEDVEARALDEPAAVVQGLAVPETVARAITPEIQVAEETGASLSQGAAGGDAWTLELACSSWATTTRLDTDSEDDKEAAARHTLEHGMTWARRAFGELILPATSVSFLVKVSFLIPRSSRASPVTPALVGRRRLSLQVGSVPAMCANSARSGPSWRCSLS
jgi:hypothetical protein